MRGKERNTHERRSTSRTLVNVTALWEFSMGARQTCIDPKLTRENKNTTPQAILFDTYMYSAEVFIGGIVQYMYLSMCVSLWLRL